MAGLVAAAVAATRHTPDRLWFSTGVRALDHAIETLQSYQSKDYCDGKVESALRLLIERLPPVKTDHQMVHLASCTVHLVR